MKDQPESTVEEFARAIREMGGPDNMARQMAEMRGWVAAFGVVHEAADPTDETAKEIVRTLYRAMREKGIETMWPLRFGETP